MTWNLQTGSLWTTVLFSGPLLRFHVLLRGRFKAHFSGRTSGSPSSGCSATSQPSGLIPRRPGSTCRTLANCWACSSCLDGLGLTIRGRGFSRLLIMWCLARLTLHRSLHTARGEELRGSTSSRYTYTHMYIYLYTYMLVLYVYTYVYLCICTLQELLVKEAFVDHVWLWGFPCRRCQVMIFGQSAGAGSVLGPAIPVM